MHNKATKWLLARVQNDISVNFSEEIRDYFIPYLRELQRRRQDCSWTRRFIDMICKNFETRKGISLRQLILVREMAHDLGPDMISGTWVWLPDFDDFIMFELHDQSFQ